MVAEHYYTWRPVNRRVNYLLQGRHVCRVPRFHEVSQQHNGIEPAAAPRIAHGALAKLTGEGALEVG
jgi:hypothetical protein